MNSRQDRVLELMRVKPSIVGYKTRDLYEDGEGAYRITWTVADTYEPLTPQDIAGMLAAGLIRCKNAGLYELATKDTHD